jgi:hypothetical protein
MTTWRPWSDIEIRSTLTILGFHRTIILALRTTKKFSLFHPKFIYMAKFGRQKLSF